MENEHDALIKQYLLKHFDAVDIVLAVDQVKISCYLGEAELRFPFYAIQYYKANPYDVVNAIWEYINTYL
jgi:hypothetical protein